MEEHPKLPLVMDIFKRKVRREGDADSVARTGVVMKSSTDVRIAVFTSVQTVSSHITEALFTIGCDVYTWRQLCVNIQFESKVQSVLTINENECYLPMFL